MCIYNEINFRASIKLFIDDSFCLKKISRRPSLTLFLSPLSTIRSRSFLIITSTISFAYTCQVALITCFFYCGKIL